MKSSAIQDVTDTALWVAAYRALETERDDALFRDPLAARLVGERGFEIAKQMKSAGRVGWAVVIRTCIIDALIQDAIASGIDAVVNLGAGLDTRPYRMNLPSTLRWIEVDFPTMIELKETRLQAEKANCPLERIALDLRDREKRRKLFTDIGLKSKRVLVLTEGVVPYLANDAAAELAQDLRAHDHFKFWVLDYFSSKISRFMRSGRFGRKLKNAPLQFRPDDWTEFFSQQGWHLKTLRSLPEEGEKLGRPFLSPWWTKIIRLVTSKKRLRALRQMFGYALLEPK